jgi:hypothetical protein
VLSGITPGHYLRHFLRGCEAGTLCGLKLVGESLLGKATVADTWPGLPLELLDDCKEEDLPARAIRPQVVRFSGSKKLSGSKSDVCHLTGTQV